MGSEMCIRDRLRIDHETVRLVCAHSVKLCPHFRLQPKFHYNIHIPAARYQVQSSRVGRACKSITGHAYHDAARRRRSIHQTIYRRTLFLAKEKNRKNVNSKANTFPDQSLFCFDREHLLQCFLQYTLNLVRGSTSGTPTWFVGRTVAPTTVSYTHLTLPTILLV